MRFQQIQKYECGANRVSAARLWRIAGALEVPVSYFFEGLDDGQPRWPAPTRRRVAPTWCGPTSSSANSRAGACSTSPARCNATTRSTDAA